MHAALHRPGDERFARTRFERSPQKQYGNDLTPTSLRSGGSHPPGAQAQRRRERVGYRQSRERKAEGSEIRRGCAQDAREPSGHKPDQMGMSFKYALQPAANAIAEKSQNR